ncbi:MAG TPA: PRC-barrel domain-containing protein [Methanocorpusculum sp.]|nr:PRC-barrel domain-containing protein [Methanocorpusculum sp.]
MVKSQITDLIGMNVYLDNATYLGVVRDVIFEVDNKKISGIAIDNINRKAIDIQNYNGLIVPFRLVKNIGDIIIIRRINGVFNTTSSFDDDD